jgi:hypothetical protein
MNEIRSIIRNYIGDKREPSIYAMRCFVGMIESGEATFDDFEAVGGTTLSAAVANTKNKLDEIRSERG